MCVFHKIEKLADQGHMEIKGYTVLATRLILAKTDNVITVKFIRVKSIHVYHS